MEEEERVTQEGYEVLHACGPCRLLRDREGVGNRHVSLVLHHRSRSHGCPPQMLVDLGQAVYVEDFEAHFLAASAEFYKASGAA